MTDIGWEVTPKPVPIELTPQFGSGVLRLEDMKPAEQEAFLNVIHTTEEALRIAHLMIDRVDNDEA